MLVIYLMMLTMLVDAQASIRTTSRLDIINYADQEPLLDPLESFESFSMYL